MLFYAFGLHIDSDIDFSGMLPKSKEAADLVIKKSTILSKEYEPTKVFRKGIQASIYIEKETIYLHWEGIVTCQIRNGNELLYQTYEENLETVKLFLLSEAIGIILAQRGHYLLHGSAVLIGSKAHVFVGIPGAGKSTTAAAFWKQGQTVLTDDLVVLSFNNNSVYVTPAFSQFKIWGKAVDGLEIAKSELTPSFEGHTKFLVMQNIESFPTEEIELESISILTTEAEKPSLINALNVSLELLKYYPLPHQLLTDKRLQTHFEESVSLAQKCELKMMHRPEGFGNLNEFVKTKTEEWK